MKQWALLLPLAGLLLGGCESTATRDGDAHHVAVRSEVANEATLPPANPAEKDGPPAADEIPANLLQIPDAVPKDEPRSDTGNPDSYVALGKRYYILQDAEGYHEQGYASWYGKKFQGRRTSSGERYDMFKMTAAHRTLPLPCYARVTNLNNDRSVIVKINDRGPFHSNRIIDLSYAAASKLGIVGHGQAPVDVRVVDADGSPLQAPDTSPTMLASSATSAAPAPTPSAPAPKPAPTPVAKAATADDGDSVARFLQTGVFSDPVNAATMRDQLHGLGFSNVLLRSEKRDSAYIYRVLIGPLLDGGAIEAARRRLTELRLPVIPLAN